MTEGLAASEVRKGVIAVGGCVRTVGSDPRQQPMRARARLRELAAQLRDDVGTLADPQTRALFATTADLLTALEQAFADAQARAEPAWRPSPAP